MKNLFLMFSLIMASASITPVIATQNDSCDCSTTCECNPCKCTNCTGNCCK